MKIQDLNPVIMPEGELDIIPFEKKAWEKAIIGEQIDGTCMTTQFSHIMSWRICSRIL